MTITLRWADDIDNVLIWEFSSQWTWQDVFETRPKSDGMMNNQPGRVDLILLTSLTAIPAGAFDHMKKLARIDLPDNIGFLVVVNSTNAIRTMVKISSKMNAAHYWKIANTYDHAKQLIEADRQQCENECGDTD